MTVILDTEHHQASLAYMDRWFVSKQRLGALAGVDVYDLDAFVEAGCAPGVVYSYHPDHGWWSALAASRGEEARAPQTGGADYWSPGAAWWLRRAVLSVRAGMTLREAAEASKAFFIAAFAERISVTPFAAYAYVPCFDAVGAIIADAVEEMALESWNGWTSGAYAVCLPAFSAERCIRKESLGARLKAALASKPGEKDHLSDSVLFELSEELAALMLPFSPWERPVGTPGLTVDRVLEQLNIGTER